MLKLKSLKREHWILLGIFLVVFVLKIYLAFSTGNLIGDETYFTIQQAEHILDHGVPDYVDDLSYGGRIHVFMPFYYYLTAFFAIIFPIEIVCKVLPIILVSSLIFVVYGLSLDLTKNKKAALVAAFFSGFIPILFSYTLNRSSPLVLGIFLSFFVLYCFVNIKKDKRYIYYYIISLIILTLTHALSVFLVAGMLLYLIIVKSESLDQEKTELELIISTIFLIIWANLLVYKKALLLYGPAVLWQNTPKELLAQHFSGFTIVQSLNLIGIVPLILGVYILYKYAFKEKLRRAYLFVSYVLVVFILLWARLIALETGLIFLGLFLVILSSQSVKKMLIYTEKSRAARFSWAVIVILIIIFVATSTFASYFSAKNAAEKAYSDEEIDAFRWIDEELDKDATIVAGIDEGNLITAISKRKNVIDNDFMLITNIDQRYEDVKRIYTTKSETEAITLLTKYSAKYIVVSERTKKYFGIDDLSYSGDENCFYKLYDKGTEIYELRCEIEEVSAS